MKKKKHVKQNRLAYFIMGVGYLSEPGFGVLYFGGFFLKSYSWHWRIASRNMTRGNTGMNNALYKSCNTKISGIISMVDFPACQFCLPDGTYIWPARARQACRLTYGAFTHPAWDMVGIRGLFPKSHGARQKRFYMTMDSQNRWIFHFIFMENPILKWKIQWIHL